ncbi:hypothetical protein, partial [Phascolarctobacterium succinatutens]|uniref:hypothetical protein n=1 Tax=Phascolarctobacterium succinatutens TaxID=626940 RepID=UPI0026F166D2
PRGVADWIDTNHCRVALPKFRWNGGDAYEKLRLQRSYGLWRIYSGVTDIYISVQQIIQT